MYGSLDVVMSSLMFLGVKDIGERGGGGGEVVMATEMRKVLSMFRDPRNRGLVAYSFFPGITVGFYATYISRLVTFSLPQ